MRNLPSTLSFCRAPFYSETVNFLPFHFPRKLQYLFYHSRSTPCLVFLSFSLSFSSSIVFFFHFKTLLSFFFLIFLIYIFLVWIYFLRFLFSLFGFSSTLQFFFLFFFLTALCNCFILKHSGLTLHFLLNKKFDQEPSCPFLSFFSIC